MWDFSETTTQKARKNYVCDACVWVMNSLNAEVDLTEDEYKLWEAASEDGFEIVKGQEYTKVSGKWEGDFSVFRCRPEIDEICHKYNLYDC